MLGRSVLRVFRPRRAEERVRNELSTASDILRLGRRCMGKGVDVMSNIRIFATVVHDDVKKSGSSVTSKSISKSRV